MITTERSGCKPAPCFMRFMDEKKTEKKIMAEALAKDILTLSRNSLAVNFRFLDRALNALSFVADENVSLATDGANIYYSPMFILYCYKTEQTAVTRDMLHCLLHCVYRHFFFDREMDRLRWDLACDIAVENSINSLASPVLHSKRRTRQQASISVLEDKLDSLTAERIYKWLGDENISEEELDKLRELFVADGHGPWYGQRDPNAKADPNMDIKKLWEDVSKRMQTELETINNDKSGALVQNLRSLNRARYSYTDFLRRFGVHGEVMRLSDDEFDQNYYSYGMELYGNIPLIEPLEYSEQRRIRDFVIAIDTSGSVKGEVVQSFIQHTHDILQQQESFFTRVNMHIIQCDDQIREDVCIKSREDFDEYIKHMEILGLGKTDFRPVFAHVDELMRKKEIQNLQGLIYFTDGEGRFPERKPDYDTAFILHTQGYAQPELPSWAMSLTLNEEDILDKRFSAY